MRRYPMVMSTALAVAGSLSLAACAGQSTEAEFEGAWRRFQERLAGARTAVSGLAPLIAKALAEGADPDIRGMDVAAGGTYRLYDGRMYANRQTGDGVGCIATGSVPVDDAVKRRLLRLESMRDPLRAASRRHLGLTFLSRDGLGGCVYPWLDLASTIKPGLDYTRFPWYEAATPARNPGRGPLWMPVPYAILVSGTWVLDVVAPVWAGPRFEGVLVGSVYIAALAREILGAARSPLFLCTRAGASLGTSRAAAALGVPGLQLYPTVRQMTENPLLPAENHLTNAANPPDLRALGAQVAAGAERFTVELAGRKYRGRALALSEVPGLLLVGLVRD